MEINNITELIGKTFVSAESIADTLTLTDADGKRFQFWHDQDSCEGVQIESIVGDLSDLVGTPILKAEEIIHRDENPEGVAVPDHQESFTWTFYKFATIKGYVDVRWYGESNGYYSEAVSYAWL